MINQFTKPKRKIEHPDYPPHPLRRPGPAQDDRKTNIPLDVKIREFNFASKTLKSEMNWLDIQAVAVSDSLRSGVIFVETEKGSLVVKGSENPASGYFLSQFAQCLALPVPQMRIVRWDEPEFKTLTKELQRATFIHSELHKKVTYRLERPYLQVQEYIPGISLAGMGRMRAAKILNFYDPTSRHRVIYLGMIMAFDIFINNPTRYPLEVWKNPPGDVEHIITRTEPRFTDTTRELRDSENLSFDYEYMYALDSQSRERPPGYYLQVEEFLNKLFMEMKSVMMAQLDPLYESKDQKIEVLQDFKQLVYDHTLYEMKEMSLLQILLGIVIMISNIVELGPVRLAVIYESVQVDTDWKDTWSSNLKTINIDYLETMISIYKKYSELYSDVIRYAKEITLNQYAFDEQKYLDIVMMNPKIKERILKEKAEHANDLLNEPEVKSEQDESEVMERDIQDEELDKKIQEMFMIDAKDVPKAEPEPQKSANISQHSIHESPPKKTKFGGILLTKLQESVLVPK